MAKAAMVDDLQNKNQELIKQIEICHVSGCIYVVKCYVHTITWTMQFIYFILMLKWLLFFAFQEENKILDKLHRQKVAEVEKLSQTVRDLEEAVLRGGAAANAVRDYQRKVQEMNVTNYHWISHFFTHCH